MEGRNAQLKPGAMDGVRSGLMRCLSQAESAGAAEPSFAMGTDHPSPLGAWRKAQALAVSSIRPCFPRTRPPAVPEAVPMQGHVWHPEQSDCLENTAAEHRELVGGFWLQNDQNIQKDFFY